VYEFGLRLLGDRALAEELVQESFLRLTTRRRPAAQREGPPTKTIEPIVPVRFSAYEIRRLVVLMQPQPPHAERIRRGLAWSF
jgi:hypothetical protein